MARAASPAPSRFLLLAAIVVAVAGLYLAREVLIPLALAVLFSFLLAPLASRLERWVGRVASVVLSVALALGVLLGVGWLVAGQVVELANQIPAYKDNIRAKIQAVRVPVGGGIERARQTMEELTDELDQEQALQRGPTHERGVAVRIVDQPATALQAISQALLPLVAPLVTAGIVIVFVLFILIRQEDLRDRFIRLMGKSQIHITTQVLDDAAQRVSRYLIMVSLLGGVHGAIVATGLLLIGLPNAILWGILSGLLRFIPFLGPWIAGLLPITLALAVGETWHLPLMVIGFIVVLELFSNNVLEPLLYGASTGLSPLAVLVAAVFWTWLWGGLGLLMATPLTVCLVVLGKYVPQLEFLDVLLSDERVLEPQTRLYQRLLALDSDEAAEIVHEYAQQRPLIQVYDQMAIPALRLAEHDRHRGHLGSAQQAFIRRTMLELIQELGGQDARGNGIVREPAETKIQEAEKIRVVCLPAADEADEIVARMFAQVLSLHGVAVEVGSVEALAGEMLELIDPAADIVCISALPPSAVAHARYLCKRLRARFEGVRLLVGLWHVRADLHRAAARIGCADTDRVVSTLAEALEQVRQFSEPIALKRGSDRQTRLSQPPRN